MENLVKPRIIVTCMDPRMNSVLEDYFYGSLAESTHVIRTAGGRLDRDLVNEIKSLNPGSFVWLPHTDCAALGVAHQEFDKQYTFPSHPIVAQTTKILRDVLRDHETEDITFERFVAIQVTQGEARLRREFRDIQLTSELVDVSQMDKNERFGKVLIVSEYTRLPPSVLISNATNILSAKISGFNADDKKFYVLQVPKIPLTDHDIQLAKDRLGISTIIFQRNVKQLPLPRMRNLNF